MTKDEWDDGDFARRWDQAALAINPTRAEQLDILASLVEHIYQAGNAILDLGIGSGLVEELLFARRPDAYVVGVESSSAMIDLAKARLQPFEKQYTIIQYNLTDAGELGRVLPSRPYQVVISVQALHHLPHEKQREVCRFVSQLLEDGGVYLLMDRISLAPGYFAGLYRTVWERLERVSEVKSGLSGDKFLEQLENKGDHSASFEEQLAFLREAGLHATCLHLHLNRALVAGVKRV